MTSNKDLAKKERELFDKIGTFVVGHPTFEQAKLMEEYMSENCKWCDIKHFDGYFCKLAETRCDTLPSKCIHREVYAKALEDIKKKLDNDDF